VITTTTIAAMLAAVKAAPDDDTLRLALADCLEENAGAVCWNCKGKGKVSVEFSRVPPTHADVECGICSGSGVGEESNGFAEWAELIRVQCELARGEPCESVGKWAKCNKVPECRNCALRRRSDALRAEHEARWRRGPACGLCADPKATLTWSESNMRYEQLPGLCPDCRGSGWTGPLGERDSVRFSSVHPPDEDWRHPADFRRGFIHRVETPLADVFAGDDVTPWAVRVARWPCVCLEEWGLTDEGLVWQTSYENPPMWYWNPRRIPQSVWDILDSQADAASAGFPFDTEAAARLALAVAVAAVVNEAARERG
jgi:uncharacterized protein (TIGR02996 family)